MSSSIPQNPANNSEQRISSYTSSKNSHSQNSNTLDGSSANTEITNSLKQNNPKDRANNTDINATNINATDIVAEPEINDLDADVVMGEGTDIDADTDTIIDEDIDDDGDIEDFEEDEKSVNGQQSGDVLEVNAEHIVSESEAGQRVDKLAAEIFSEHSRGQLQDWLKSENLMVNGTAVKSKHRVKEGDKLVLDAVLEQHSSDRPENIDLDVIYEDDSVVVINKPVGMVVHPGAGNWSGTLVNGLLYHYPNQAHLPRAGLVHRIDKNTSGLLVIGKTKAAQLNLQEQLKDKSVYRHYRCVVAGDAASLTRQRVIDAPIGRHRVQRTKMTVTSNGKHALTHIIKITPLNESYSLLDVKLETGRTHQIRVHLSHIGHPIIGDDVYGNRQQLRAGLTPEQRETIQKFPRQALHAYKLGFIHPESGEPIELTAPLPDDILQLCEVLSD